MSAVTGFAILTLVFAYLAINTPERHGPLQIGHYVLIHVMALFTGYVAFTESSTEESTAELLGGFVGSYSYIVYMVGAYFFIYILVQAFEFYQGDS
jgi:ABC-type transport system involved in cytochrome c biogenesis permease subunit